MDIFESILKERQNKLREETTDASIETMVSMFETVELNEALSPKDKKVIDAFYDGKDMDGKFVKSVGDKLETTGMGAQVILKRHQNKFRVFAVIDSRRVQEILRYIKKSYPKNTIIEGVEEGKLVSTMAHVTSVILAKVAHKIDKLSEKNPETAESMLNDIGKMVGHKVTSKQQDKGILFLKFGDNLDGNLVEDAAIDAAELKAKQVGELERLKLQQEKEMEALTTRHERETERVNGEKEKETQDKAIKTKRDAERKKSQSESLTAINKLRGIK